jgi:hypothetical protein
VSTIGQKVIVKDMSGALCNPPKTPHQTCLFLRTLATPLRTRTRMLASRSDCKLILSSPAWVFEVKFVCSNLGCSSSKLCDVLAISFEEDSCSINHRSALKNNPSCGIIHPQVQHPSSFRRLVRQQPLLPELAGPVGREGAMRASANRVCGNADLRNEKTRSATIRRFCVTAYSYDQPPRIALHQL